VEFFSWAVSKKVSVGKCGKDRNIFCDLIVPAVVKIDAVVLGCV